MGAKAAIILAPLARLAFSGRPVSVGCLVILPVSPLSVFSRPESAIFPRLLLETSAALILVLKRLRANSSVPLSGKHRGCPTFPLS